MQGRPLLVAMAHIVDFTFRFKPSPAPAFAPRAFQFLWKNYCNVPLTSITSPYYASESLVRCADQVFRDDRVLVKLLHPPPLQIAAGKPVRRNAKPKCPSGTPV